MNTPLPPKRIGAYYLVLSSAFVLTYFASFLIVRPWAELPVFDDWVFAKDCLMSARMGHPVYTGLEAPWLIPQLLYGTLAVKAFGFSHVLLRGTTCLAMVGALIVFDLYLRHAGIRLGTRLIAWFSLAFHPFIYPQVVSFMTDVPFLLAWLGACYCWDRTLESRTTRWLITATAMTIVATAQRQFGLFIPASALLLLLIEMRLSPRALRSFVRLPPRDFPARLTLCFVALGLFTGTVLLVWRFYVHGYMQPLYGHRGWKDHFHLTFVTLNSFTLGALPLLLATRPAGRVTTTPTARAVSFALCIGFLMAALWFVAHGTFPLYQNIISQFGFLQENEVLLGQRPVLFGPTYSRLLVGAGTAAFLLMVPRLGALGGGALRRFGHRAEPDLETGSRLPRGDAFGGVLMLSSALYVLFNLYRGVPFFDRYTLPAIPALLFAVAKASPFPAPSFLRGAAVAVVTIFATVSITLTHDYFRWREAAWQTAESLLHQGIPVETIQAGYEWYGWHIGTELFPPSDLRRYPYVVAHSVLPEYESLGVVPWTSFWSPRERQVFLLRRTKSFDSTKASGTVSR